MRAPSFQLYVRDWLCSKTIRRLHVTHPRAISAYLYLLCESWLEDPPVTLPSDPDELAVMARVDRDEWTEIWKLIQHQFESDGNGRIFCTKLMEIRNNGKVKAANGRLGGLKTAANQSAKRKSKQKG